MITSRNNFHFYLQANMMINRGYFKEPLKKKLLHLMAPDLSWSSLRQWKRCNTTLIIAKMGGLLLIISNCVSLGCLASLGLV